MAKAPTDYLDYVYFTGWDYAMTPPADVADGAYLNHSDPWLVFCCVLERAKLGDFDSVGRLPALWDVAGVSLQLAVQYLLASVGTEQQLSVLDAEITEERSRWRMEAADHAAVSGSLRFVDIFISGYRAAFGETSRMAMEEGLSNLLSIDDESRVVVDCLTSRDRPKGEAHLRALAHKQCASYGPKVSLYRGVPVTLQAISADIIETLADSQPVESRAHLQGLLTRLQTMVGFSQAGMFNDDDTWNEEPICAQLERASKLSYEPGVRYFFGHPAPL